MKSGFIAIVGRPNSGKSTLINNFVKEKISIVSPKPQTTRDKVLGIWTDSQYQMIFVDTPGQLKSDSRLGDYMVRSIDDATADVDAIVVVIDGHNGISKQDIELVNKYLKRKIPLVVAVNKIDISQANKLMPELSKLNEIEGIDSVFAISAMRNRNVNDLKQYLTKFLNDDIMYFEADDITDKSQRYLVCELIREKMLLLLEDEIPHGVAVSINKMEFQQAKGSWEIDADIIVERSSHKPIVLGAGGSMIKRIGINARTSIEKLLNAHIYLTLWVRIKEDWRNSKYVMREVGYNFDD